MTSGDGSAERRGSDEGTFLPVRYTSYPAPRPVRVRWMVTAEAGTVLPDGAALVDRGQLLGVLRRPWSGQSLVLPFGRELDQDLIDQMETQP